MGDVGFGKSYGQLESGKLHPAVHSVAKWLRVAISGWQVPWVLNILQTIPGTTDPGRDMKKFSEVCLREREKARKHLCFHSDHISNTSFLDLQQDPDLPDILSFVFKGYDGKSKWPVDDRTMIDDVFMLQVCFKPVS
jgi:hypothetical protein